MDITPASENMPGVQQDRSLFRICLVSDFFLPGFGGVEVHIYNLAQCLAAQGHHVVVITRAYSDRVGIRWITNGVKVYHLPLCGLTTPNGTVVWPTVPLSAVLFRPIWLRERISIVHCHQSTSTLAHEAMFCAKVLGLRVVFTDHSLFGFYDVGAVHLNKLAAWSLCDVDHVICVSNTCRENTVLRSGVSPYIVSVIPNATDTSRFTPRPDFKYRTWASVASVTIVVLTRLTYRKGVDLLCAVVPELCARHPDLKVIIGGDGPRRQQIVDMCERHSLFDRVCLAGAIAHDDVPAFLRRGQIFLNLSLTEAFCIAILEAAACGLLTVSTRVGGVPEVLPADMLIYAEPLPEALVAAAEQALVTARSVSPWEFHRRVASFYAWPDVAARTARVYEKVARTPPLTLLERFVRLWRHAVVFGKFQVVFFFLHWLVIRFHEFFIMPAAAVDLAPDFPRQRYARLRARLSSVNHLF
eukprot:TRINITY_DN59272_c0_g1_i1.p1 TRINITY_DN59272_c0_g1~~TRINITY_DN59272_c0_g1_i1.p1  ORF type:complete len:470 (-),score=88.88 TRINITY_DN59272_c0_g1_i1:23-1432(-)